MLSWSVVPLALSRVGRVSVVVFELAPLARGISTARRALSAVFDLGRAVALLWALTAAWRARGWREAWLLVACAYVVALEVASGIAVRDEGPLMPVLSLLLIFLGPSGMPRGHLPAWPLAEAVQQWPATVDATVGAAAGYFCWRRHRQSRLSNEYAADFRSSTRVELALLLIAVFEGVYAVVRALPLVAGNGL